MYYLCSEFMANDYFQFKQFTVYQQRCAMKVGTDGTLLGAWAQVPTESARILDIGTGTGLIVSNPPYFVNSLTCPDDQRTMARHSVSLTYDGLMESAFRLLKPEGVFSLVIPSESRSLLEAAAHLKGFFLSRVCMIRTTPKKQPKRQLIEFLKHPVNELCIEDGIIEDSPNVRSAWYQQLTQDFYIR